jgi:hypothetical protein
MKAIEGDIRSKIFADVKGAGVAVGAGDGVEVGVAVGEKISVTLQDVITKLIIPNHNNKNALFGNCQGIFWIKKGLSLYDFAALVVDRRFICYAPYLEC